MKKIFTLLTLVLFMNCGEASQSQLSDIYSNDNITRKQATSDQTLWSIYIKGCTGSALTSEYILTAQHCMIQAGDRLKSGLAVLRGQGTDIVVEKVAENSYRYDYSILKVRWENNEAKQKQKYSPKISTNQSDLDLGRDNVGTKVFTVGFPADKPKSLPSHAYGFSKMYSQGNLV